MEINRNRHNKFIARPYYSGEQLAALSEDKTGSGSTTIIIGGGGGGGGLTDELYLKLAGIEEGAQVNQDAFSYIELSDGTTATLIEATNPTDTANIEFEGVGVDVTITPTDKIDLTEVTSTGTNKGTYSFAYGKHETTTPPATEGGEPTVTVKWLLEIRWVSGDRLLASSLTNVWLLNSEGLVANWEPGASWGTMTTNADALVETITLEREGLYFRKVQFLNRVTVDGVDLYEIPCDFDIAITRTPKVTIKSLTDFWKLDEKGNLYTTYNTYSTKELSAYGLGPGEEPIGALYLHELKDVDTTNIKDDGILLYNSTTSKWEVTDGSSIRPDLTGYATLAWVNTTLSSYATTTYVNTQIANLVNGSPEALDTLKELADALGNDPNFATTVLDKIGVNTNNIASNAREITDLKAWVSMFLNMFEWDKSASATDSTKWIIKAKASLYSVAEIAAYGYQEGEVPTGAQYMHELKDVTLTSLSTGQLLQWDGTKWVNIDKDAVGLNESELATYLTTNNYAKKSDINWSSLSGKPSWIGSTKPSYSYSEITGTPTVLWDNVLGRPAWIDVSAKPAYTFAEINEKPTTLVGYGITDGVNTAIKSGSGNAVVSLSVSGHSLTYTMGSFVESSTFDDLFEKVNVGTAAAPIYAIKAKYHFYSVGEVSAYGYLEAQAPTGAQYMYELKDVTLTSLSNGQLLQWNGTSWVNINKDEVGLNESELATYLTTNNYAKKSDITWGAVANKPTWIGNVKPSYDYSEISGTPTSLKNPYSLTIQRHGTSVGTYDGSAAKTLNIAAPSWTEVTSKPTWIGSSKPSYAFSEITGKPTTLSGYGITDAYTKTQTNDLLAVKADKATTLSGYGITDAYTKTLTDTLLSGKADKATTLAGYGITDGINAVNKAGSGNALTSLSISGHTLTYTMGTTFLTQSIFDDLFEKVNVGTAAAPVYAIKAKYHLFSVGEVTAWASDGVSLPSIWDSLPIDSETLGWVNGVLTVIGGVGNAGSIRVNGTTYYPNADGLITLPNYPSDYVTLTTTLTISGVKSFSNSLKFIKSNSALNQEGLEYYYSGSRKGMIGAVHNGSVISYMQLNPRGDLDGFNGLVVGDELGFNGHQVFHSGNTIIPTVPEDILTKSNYTNTLNKVYVTSLSTSGDYLTWTKNGVANSLTIPYAGVAGKLRSLYIASVTTAPGNGNVISSYNISSSTSGIFPVSDNANGLITINTHNGNYFHQLGFSGNGYIYHRYFNNLALNTSKTWVRLLNNAGVITTDFNTVRNGGFYNSLDNVANKPSSYGGSLISLPGISTQYSGHIFCEVATNKWFLRSTNSTSSWLSWQQILTNANYSATLDGRYYTESEADSRFVNVTGDTMTGNLHIASPYYIYFASDSDKAIGSNGIDGTYLKYGSNMIKATSTHPYYNSNKMWHAGNDGSGSGLDADLLDGVQYQNILERNYSAIGSQTTYAAWYRIGEFLMNNALSPQAIIMINRSYNSPMNEGYTFSISLGYNGEISVSQLTGTIGGHLITQIRIDYTNSGKAFLDVYCDYTGYVNTIYVTSIGAFKTYTTYTINPTVVGTTKTYSTYNGIYSNHGFNGSVIGNSTTATKLQTSRSIWGLWFDGTTNISGDMSSVGTILSSGNDTKRIGSASNQWQGIYAGWVSAGTNQNLILAANDSNKVWILTNGSVGIGFSPNSSYKLHVNGHIRADGILSAGEHIDDQYGYVNVTRPNSANNYCCYAFVKVGVSAYGMGYTSGGELWLGHPNANRVANAYFLRTTTTSTVFGSNSYVTINSTSTNPYTSYRLGSYTWYSLAYNNHMYLGNGSAYSLRIDTVGNTFTPGNIEGNDVYARSSLRTNSSNNTNDSISQILYTNGDTYVRKASLQRIINTISTTRRELDLRSYNSNTWYPCWINGNLAYGYRKLLIRVTLEGNKPVWATHNSGFTLAVDMTILGHGWGTMNYSGAWLDHIDMLFGGETAFGGYEQNNSASDHIVWLRGGAMYYYYTDLPNALTTSTSGYSWVSGNYSFSRSPRTTQGGYYDGFNHRRFFATRNMQTIEIFGQKDNALIYTKPSEHNGFYIGAANGSCIVADTNGATLSRQNLDGIYLDVGWYRSQGSYGWYNLDYAGGIYMIDSTWVRTYNKPFFSGNSVAQGPAGFNVNIATNNASHSSIEVIGGTYTMGLGCHSNGSWLWWRGTTDPWNSAYKSYVMEYNGTTWQFTGSLVATGEVTAYSDLRLKSNITDLVFRGKLKPRTYVKDNKQQIGFIAQEVLELYPELIIETNTDEKYLSLNYGNITAVLSAQINVIDDEVSLLKKRVKELEDKLKEYDNNN